MLKDIIAKPKVEKYGFSLTQETCQVDKDYLLKMGMRETSLGGYGNVTLSDCRRVAWAGTAGNT